MRYHAQVIRGGRRVEISIFDIVVGDVIPLKIGDQVNDWDLLIFAGCLDFRYMYWCILSQVPADGVLISGQSLAIDESSMTGESKIVSFEHMLFICLLIRFQFLIYSLIGFWQVHKDLKAPFLMSGCKVADGYGTMLVEIFKLYLLYPFTRSC